MLYGWKENSMLTNCLAAYAHLTITFSEIQRDICEKVVILSYPLHSTPVRGVPVGISAPLGSEKLEWCRYPMVKNFEDIFIRLDVIHERDRQTDRRTLDDSRDRACIASRGKNLKMVMKISSIIISTLLPDHTASNYGYTGNTIDTTTRSHSK